ncbi:MAG: hypothetical protein P8127_09975, partial [Acidobacteriota bacterium]
MCQGIRRRPARGEADVRRQAPSRRAVGVNHQVPGEGAQVGRARRILLEHPCGVDDATEIGGL